jgi:broad specificity phosphatase PhoE
VLLAVGTEPAFGQGLVDPSRLELTAPVPLSEAAGRPTVALVSRRVLIVQHAEKQRLPGNPGITSVGGAQAEATAAWLGDHEKLVAVWASPMRRAIETADPIARRTGHPLVADARLRERMNWDGPSVESLDEFLDDWQRASVDRDYLPRSGDSSRVAGDRFIEALGDLVATYHQGTAAVVAHGGVTVDALRNLLGDDVLWNEAADLIRGGVPSCAITTLGFDGHRWDLERLASVNHLPVCGE